MNNKKKNTALVSALSVVAIVVALFLIIALVVGLVFGGIELKKWIDRVTAEPIVDTDGDGIPDDKDTEIEDNLDNDNHVGVGDLIPKE